MRPETQKQQTAANSRIKTSAADSLCTDVCTQASCGGSFKDLRDLCVLIEVKIFQDWTFVVDVNSL